MRRRVRGRDDTNKPKIEIIEWKTDRKRERK